MGKKRGKTHQNRLLFWGFSNEASSFLVTVSMLNKYSKALFFLNSSRVTASENQQHNANSQGEDGKLFNKLHQTVSERHRIKNSQDHVLTPDEIKPLPGTRGRKAQQMVQLITVCGRDKNRAIWFVQ